MSTIDSKLAIIIIPKAESDLNHGFLLPFPYSDSYKF